jgi:Calcineurin-like phosphoesterase
MPRSTRKPKQPSPTSGPGNGTTGTTGPGGRGFGQPVPSPDPTKFSVDHGNDNPLYNLVNNTLLQAIPPPRIPFPAMALADLLDGSVIQAIQKSGQIVFHAVSDTGSVFGPTTQSLVADKMVADYSDEQAPDRPSFLYHLGDVVYSFGEAKYYYDQFYEPYRSYPAPILAVPGNHDGQVYTGDNAGSLDAFLRNFVNALPVRTPEAGGLVRTAMTQPGVYFTFDVPFVTIVGLYSNVLEDPGVVSSEGSKSSPVDDQQLTFLTAALKQAKAAKKPVILVTHHPPYTAGSAHGGSPNMLADLDKVCQNVGLWPHAHLSGHAHNYQRFTRTINNYEIPYLVCGDGGHGLTPLVPKGKAIRTPYPVSKQVTFENYTDQAYGYLRLVANATQIRIEFHPVTSGPPTKAPTDVVTVDIASHKMVAS